eukprot:TRINITY_DN4908_c0_g2_i1.p1 TRINITY_DN4908_c0_g2~~TRINITY_DN4908_c0_g2_i1.p1  ORF type:complete len:161 (+),score=19.64 TRINITY_DN4908_c0_g2_i1:580-1062(+)
MMMIRNSMRMWRCEGYAYEGIENKPLNFTCSNPSFKMIFAYLLPALRASSSDLAPVITIFPLEKIKAVVLGSLIRMITAAKRLGLYSAFLALRAISFKSNSVSIETVATIFCKTGVIASSILSENQHFFCDIWDTDVQPAWGQENKPIKIDVSSEDSNDI